MRSFRLRPSSEALPRARAPRARKLLMPLLASHLRDREHRELIEPPLPLLAILRPRIPPGSDRHLDSCDPLYIAAEIAQPRGNQPNRSSLRFRQWRAIELIDQHPE